MATKPIESVRELEQQHRREYSEMSERQAREMAAAVAREFPLGAKVTYDHGPNKITALVVEYTPYSWGADKVTVENIRSKNRKQIEAWRLTAA